MKNVLFLAALFLAVSNSYSDTEPVSDANDWKLTYALDLSVALNAYSDNWTGSDLGTFTWILRNDFVAEKQIVDWLNSRTNLKLQFGQSSTQDRETKVWAPLQKSSDQILVESVQRLTFGLFTDPFVSAGLMTQFVDETDTLRTRSFNPLELKGSAGAIKDLYRTEQSFLSSRLGFAMRKQIDRDVLHEDLVRRTVSSTDGGLDLVFDFKYMSENEVFDISSRLDIYSALFRVDDDESDNSYWRHPDVNWDSRVGISLARFLMLGINLQLLYDRELDSSPRFKHLYTIGFKYAYGN